LINSMLSFLPNFQMGPISYFVCPWQTIQALLNVCG
jgi:hypothetical protein